MKLVKLENTKDGDKLAKTILSAEGTVLLGKGVELIPPYIKRLQQLQIHSVYIIDHRFPDLEVKDLVAEATRRESVKIIKKVMDRVKKGLSLESASVLKTVNTILDDILSQESLLVNLTDIRAYDDYTFAHSVNVCVLSLLVGTSLGYDQLKLRDLGMGALLHDLGKTMIPSSIINKNTSLTAEEFNQVKKHCKHGFETIRAKKEISLLSAHVALQHHERYDGKGYPQGLRGENVLEFARIVRIADVYDALLADRPYRKRYLPHEVYEYMMGSCYTNFDPRLIAHFLKHVPPYPNGTIVRLSTKEEAVVVKQNEGCLIRPVVSVLATEDLSLSKQIEYDLLENPSILVEEVLSN